MFITKHIFLADPSEASRVSLALPFLYAMVPAVTALAQTAAVPKLRTDSSIFPRANHGEDVARPPLDR